MTYSRISLVADLRGVLRGDDHRVDADRPVAVELDGHLALAVGPEPGDFARLAGSGEPVEDAMGQGDRQGHQFGRVVAGVAEHQALVAGPDLLARCLVLVHALGDVRALPVQGDHHRAGSAQMPISSST